MKESNNLSHLEIQIKNPTLTFPLTPVRAAVMEKADRKRNAMHEQQACSPAEPSPQLPNTSFFNKIMHAFALFSEPGVLVLGH